MATKRSIVHNARNEGSRHTAVRLELYGNGTMLGRTHATLGCAAVTVPSRWRDQEAARSNRSASPVSVAVTSQWSMRKRLMTKLRVHHGLLVANMVEGHHEGVVHAACGR